MKMQTTAIIRDRGQLTIPGEIRENLNWLNPNSVVTIKISFNNELILKPYSLEEKKKVDWDKIWAGIKLARSFKGKNKMSLSEFIVKDRENH